MVEVRYDAMKGRSFVDVFVNWWTAARRHCTEAMFAPVESPVLVLEGIF
jgi:hypothetical protein